MLSVICLAHPGSFTSASRPAAAIVHVSQPGAARGPEKELRLAMDEGLAWLVAQQDDDGGWHSQTYGALKGGAATTALALYTIAHVDALSQERLAENCRRGYEFLRAGLARKGCVACPDGSLDYPTYASAMTLVAARKLQLPMTDAERASLLQYLISAQLTEQNGFHPSSPHYGGWDLLGASGARGVTSGSNVSVTYHAVEALQGEEHPLGRTALDKAAAWCQRCQNWPDDGGFFFHPAPDALGNKAQWHRGDLTRPRSYGTATCDGLACLLASGRVPDDERITAALGWLTKQTTVDLVPGFEDCEPTLGWKEGLRFYYYQALARSLRRLPKKTARDRRGALIDVLVELQQTDGRWQNASARMREDDPLIATLLALLALARLQTPTAL